jgi:DnaK suppressor protein
MLTETERNTLSDVLRAERDRLLQNAKDGLKFSMERERSIGRDSIDESMEEEIFSTELRLRDREKFLLNKINAALDRIKTGSIDECEDCGDKISFRRLLARPVTTLCIDCKEEKEKEELAKSQIVGRAGSDADQIPESVEEE